MLGHDILWKTIISRNYDYTNSKLCTNGTHTSRTHHNGAKPGLRCTTLRPKGYKVKYNSPNESNNKYIATYTLLYEDPLE